MKRSSSMAGSIRCAGCSDQGREFGTRTFSLLLDYNGFILHEESAILANNPLIMPVRSARLVKS